jgi:hypothetical protein
MVSSSNGFHEPGGNRFAKGNPGGPGDQAGPMANKFRCLLLFCVQEEDFKEVMRRLVAAAKAGESWAIKELLDRIIGKPKQQVDVGGISELVKLVKGDCFEEA